MLEITASMLIWGTLGMFVLWSKVSAIDLTFFRCLIGALSVGLYLLKSGRRISFNRSTLIISLAGIFAVANWLFLFKSFQLASITIGNMAYYLQPIILLLLGFMCKFERFSWRKVILILLACLGVALTIRLDSFAVPNILLGVSCALFAAILYSLVTLMMRNIHADIFVIIFIQLLIGVLMTAPLASFSVTALSGWWCLLIIGLVHTPLAYFLYYRGIKKASVTQIAVLSYLDPIVAIISDIVFFNQHLNGVQLFGISLTFLAGFMLIRLKLR
ncbi:MAG: DMT family transporter [Burkholderiales bacterium]|jgi:drug/metabolite transporter (DMT)-like permease|nr:DMT family transporter [Burkholderiales bacterium]